MTRTGPVFRDMTPGERDRLVLEIIKTRQPLSLKGISIEMQYPPREVEPDERSIDGSLQRLRRAGFVRVYPKRGLWSVKPTCDDCGRQP